MTKISQLPQDSAPTNTDYIVVVDAETGQTKRVLLSSLFSQPLIGASGIYGIDKSLLTTDSNPYKFFAYPTAYTATTGTTKVTLSNELYDTNNNFDPTTNYRYTVPVTGYYQLSGQVGYFIVNGVIGQCLIYKNGSQFIRGTTPFNNTGGNLNMTATVNPPPVLLTAGDYLELYSYCNQPTSYTLEGGTTPLITYFGGFLTSRT